MGTNPFVERWTITFSGFIFALSVCVLGCNPGPVPTYPTSGRVVFPDRSPLPGGNIEFAPTEGTVKTSARGMIEEDGTFQLSTFHDGDGAIEGVHRVLIIPARRRGEVPGKGARNIDDKYQSFDTSGLEATVSPDSKNEFEFVVRPPGKTR